MGVSSVVVRKGCPMPLPVAPTGSAPVSPGVDLRQDDEGGVVFVWGMASWCSQRGDVVGRRLAAVQLVATKTEKPGEEAAAFEVDQATCGAGDRSTRRAGCRHWPRGERGPGGRRS